MIIKLKFKFPPLTGIALLKQEEEKAWKKIDETRKRAGEIVGLRTVNEGISIIYATINFKCNYLNEGPRIRYSNLTPNSETYCW